MVHWYTGILVQWYTIIDTVVHWYIGAMVYTLSPRFQFICTQHWSTWHKSTRGYINIILALMKSVHRMKLCVCGVCIHTNMCVCCVYTYKK